MTIVTHSLQSQFKIMKKWDSDPLQPFGTMSNMKLIIKDIASSTKMYGEDTDKPRRALMPSLTCCLLLNADSLEGCLFQPMPF